VTRAPADRSHLSIGEVLSLLQDEFPDVTISKIRFLESQGLLDPERTPSGYRKFYETDIERLRWILRQQKDHYLPLKVIKDRLDDITPRDDEPEPRRGQGARTDRNHGTADRSPGPASAPSVSGAAAGGASARRSGPTTPTTPAPLPLDERLRGVADDDRRRAAGPDDRNWAGVDERRGGGSRVPGPVNGPEPAARPAPDAPVRPTNGTSHGPAPHPPAPSPGQGPGPGPGPAAPPAPAAPTGPVAPTAPTAPTAPARAPSVPSLPSLPWDAPAPPVPLGPLGAEAGFEPPANSVSLTIDELAEASGMGVRDLRDLERFGLLEGHQVGDDTYYDGDALVVARTAGGFLQHGIEARHLRTYKVAMEREAGLFEQIVLPLLKQRNPEAHRRAARTVAELVHLGEVMRGVLLRRELRNNVGP
jgi:DNA-binding transcriptional MerR regulator